MELKEGQYDALKLYALDELVSGFQKEGYRIVKHRAHFKNQVKGAGQIFAPEQQLQDLQPKEVFLELIKRHEYDGRNTQRNFSSIRRTPGRNSAG